MTIADEEHDLLVEIQDWIFLNAEEYKDGQMTDIEVIKDIYARLHREIDTNIEMLEALKDATLYFKSDQLILHPWDRPEESCVATQLLEKMQAAIAKAEGESNDRKT